MRTLFLEKKLFGFPIQMRLTPLDCGVHILLTGGQRGHVGAAALGEDGRIAGAASFPGHKEQQVAERWAQVLSEAWRVPVTVACGIHYDSATREQIEAVLQICEALLEETLEMMGNQVAADEICPQLLYSGDSIPGGAGGLVPGAPNSGPEADPTQSSQ